jgi:hypothetical protein
MSQMPYNAVPQFSSRGSSVPFGRGSNRGRRVPKCWGCGRYGHVYNDCRMPFMNRLSPLAPNANKINMMDVETAPLSAPVGVSTSTLPQSVQALQAPAAAVAQLPPQHPLFYVLNPQAPTYYQVRRLQWWVTFLKALKGRCKWWIIK